MPIDRDETLRKADKLLRQGRLDAAIVEYERLVTDHPADWAAANTLGDLYVRAGQLPRASGEFVRIADHFLREGFFAKASALYKKVLKLNPEHDTALEHLGDTCAAQGLVLDARQHHASLLAKRRARGDQAGADALVIKLARLEPDNADLQLESGRALIRAGQTEMGLLGLRRAVDTWMAEGREAHARSLLAELLEVEPSNTEIRTMLLRAALDEGDWPAFERLIAPIDPLDETWRWLALDAALRRGLPHEARRIVSAIVADGDIPEALAALCCKAASDASTLFAAIDPIVQVLIDRGEAAAAADLVRRGVEVAPTHLDALLVLLDLGVDANLPDVAEDAQSRLAELHLAEGRLAEARTIAEDLLSRRPSDIAHRARLRRILEASGEPDPDGAIEHAIDQGLSLVFEMAEPAAVDGRAADDVADAVERSPADDEGQAHGEVPGATNGQPEVAAVVAEAPTGTAGTSTPEEGVRPERRSVAPQAERPTPLKIEGAEGRRRPGTSAVEIDLTAALDRLSSHGAAEVDEGAGPSTDGADEALEAAELQLTLARAYVEAGQFTEALEPLAAARANPGTSDEAMLLFGELWSARSEWTAAAECYERVLESPAPAALRHRAQYALAVALERMGQAERALVTYLELLSETSDFLDARARSEALARAHPGG